MSDPLLVPILLVALAMLLALWPQHPEPAPRPHTRHGGAGPGTLTVRQLQAQLAGAAGDSSGATGTELRAAATASATTGSSGLPESGAVVPTQSRSEPEPIRWPETDPDEQLESRVSVHHALRDRDDESHAVPATSNSPATPNTEALAAWQTASRHTTPRGTAVRRAPGPHHRHTSRCQPAPTTVGALPDSDPNLALLGRVLEGLRRL
ncbi:hypothetical protein SAMN04487904_10294 [Actinopolyspora lacussalsi subsp. righensis]|uniref:Uncharacterized protein n=1 Tax=Actinopolyspora righensis TaxID=995060 RepID=A0A1I6Y165_9ACTN|nr:hypothetical protein [Actinopolyspora righensis]SFT43981.1 hypothetical protein SAMN04487904_10294 [Actinopolyspora righensis]